MPNPPAPGRASNMMPADIFDGVPLATFRRSQPPAPSLVDTHSDLAVEIRKLREAIERQESRALWDEFSSLTAAWRAEHEQQGGQ